MSSPAPSSLCAVRICAGRLLFLCCNALRAAARCDSCGKAEPSSRICRIFAAALDLETNDGLRACCTLFLIVRKESIFCIRSTCPLLCVFPAAPSRCFSFAVATAHNVFRAESRSSPCFSRRLVSLPRVFANNGLFKFL